MASGAAVLCFLAIVALGYVQSGTTFRESESYQQKALECQNRALDRLPKETKGAITVQLLENISSYCYDDLRRINQLEDSTIHRGMYIHQRLENNIILFMVVFITLSGVALSGVQLLTSFNLAAIGRAQEDGATNLTIEQGKLSIKSSVTGLVVLVISLGFFGIYVSQVYSIVPNATVKDVPQTMAAESQPAPAPTPDARGIVLESGGLGAPPKPEARKH